MMDHELKENSRISKFTVNALLMICTTMIAYI